MSSIPQIAELLFTTEINILMYRDIKGVLKHLPVSWVSTEYGKGQLRKSCIGIHYYETCSPSSISRWMACISIQPTMRIYQYHHVEATCIQQCSLCTPWILIVSQFPFSLSSSWPPSETPIGSPVMRILNLNPRWGELLLMLCVRQNSSKWWSNSSSITTWLLIVGTGVSRKCLQWLHNVLHFINNTRHPSSVNTPHLR